MSGTVLGPEDTEIKVTGYRNTTCSSMVISISYAYKANSVSSDKERKGGQGCWNFR